MISSLEMYISDVYQDIGVEYQRCITKKRFNIENGMLNEEKISKNEEENDYSAGKNLEVLLRKLRHKDI